MLEERDPAHVGGTMTRKERLKEVKRRMGYGVRVEQRGAVPPVIDVAHAIATAMELLDEIVEVPECGHSCVMCSPATYKVVAL